MLVKPSLPKHTSEDLEDAFAISIPSPRQWLSLLFLGFCLIGWIYIFFDTMKDLINQLAFGINWFLIFWLSGWTISGIFAIFFFFWHIFGKEVVEVNNKSIVISYFIAGFRLPKEYSSKYIKGLRVLPFINNVELFRSFKFWGYQNSSISFNYRDKTIKFARSINEAEGKQIIEEIQQKYPQYRK